MFVEFNLLFLFHHYLYLGADKLSNYEEVLRGVRYVNARPEELNSRTFILTCTELNGRFVSNQLDVTVSVIMSYLLYI